MACNPELSKTARREMLRAERTQTPLAVALFRLPTDNDVDFTWLLEIVRKNSRETDLPFRLDNGSIAVLLLDTGLAGAESFVRKILSQTGGYTPEVAVQQYPAPLFRDLLGGDPVFPTASRATKRSPDSQQHVNASGLRSPTPRKR